LKRRAIGLGEGGKVRSLERVTGDKTQKRTPYLRRVRKVSFQFRGKEERSEKPATGFKKKGNFCFGQGLRERRFSSKKKKRKERKIYIIGEEKARTGTFSEEGNPFCFAYQYEKGIQRRIILT